MDYMSNIPTVVGGKIRLFLEKRPFFRADMAGLGKYCMGGYGRIGVYRVNHFIKVLIICCIISVEYLLHMQCYNVAKFQHQIVAEY